MEEVFTAACRSSAVRSRGLPRSDRSTGHGGEFLEARAALGTVGVHAGDALMHNLCPTDRANKRKEVEIR